MKEVWAKIKVGLIPLVVIVIPAFIVYKTWLVISNFGVHPFSNDLLDVPINISIILVIAYSIGCLFKRPNFQEFSKKHFVNIPIVGGILLHIIVPRCDLRLVELKTFSGPSNQEGDYEYALVMRESWKEDGKTWYCVHTLGWAGRLFSRVSESNIRNIPDNQQKEAWVTIFSVGLIK